MSPEVTTNRDGAIEVITLNRPEKMNAFNTALFGKLMDAVSAANKDPDVRVMVITGSGRAFCAGADIEGGFGGAGLTEGPEFIDGIMRDYGGRLVLRLWDCDTPIIAAVNGTAVGIGATMLLPMDIKIAAKGAKMGMPFSRRGIAFDGASSWFLPRIVGVSRAQHWIATGEIFRSEDALAAGMISEICEPADVLPRAMEIARDMAVNCSPQSMALNKQLLRSSLVGDTDGPFKAHMAESEILMTRFASDDCREGVASFFEKRTPKFDANTG